MPDKGWKAAERAFAGDLGTTRIAVTGERHGADFLDSPCPGLPQCRYQLKVRLGMPTYLLEWLLGLRRSRKSAQQVPVVIWARPHCPRADALVVLTWADYLTLRQGFTSAPQEPVEPDAPDSGYPPGASGPVPRPTNPLTPESGC